MKFITTTFILIVFFHHPSYAQPSFEEYSQYYDKKAINDAIEVVSLSRQPRIGEGSFLLAPVGYPPVSIFVKMAEGLRPLCRFEDPHIFHIPELGTLAQILFSKMTSHICDEAHKHEVAIMQAELTRFIREKNTSFLWYSTFTDRLAMLICSPANRDTFVSGNTTFPFASHVMNTQNSAGQKLFLSHEDYMIFSTSDYFTDVTHAEATEAAIAKNHFAVKVAYPYALGKYDIVTNLPTPKSGAWLSGIPIFPENADGKNYNQPAFKTHDDEHFLRYLQSLNCVKAYLADQTKKYEPPKTHTIATYIESWRHTALEAVEAMKIFVKNGGKSNHWRIFFAILFLHEPSNFATCLNELAQYGPKDVPTDLFSMTEIFSNKEHMKSLFPQDVSTTLNDCSSPGILISICIFFCIDHYPKFRSEFEEFCDSCYPDLIARLKTVQKYYFDSRKRPLNLDISHISGTILFRKNQKNKAYFDVDKDEYAISKNDPKFLNSSATLKHYWLDTSILEENPTRYNIHVTSIHEGTD